MNDRSHPSQISAQTLRTSLGRILSGSTDSQLAHKAINLRINVISTGGVPRWVLPANSSRAVPVLENWKPYKLASRLQWSAIVTACRLNLVTMLPGAAPENVRCDISYWQERIPGFSECWATVAYVGNHSPTRKAILFFVDERGHVRAVAKVPIYPEAAGAILNEAKMLKCMEDRLPVPRVLFVDEQKGIAAESWIEGVNIPRRFGPEQLEMLTSFGSSLQRVRLSDFRKELEERIALLRPAIEPSLLRRALSFMDSSEEVKGCIEHGDFAPWNFKRLADGRLTLLDWEWAKENGFPWQDACRYFYVPDYLFCEGANVWEKMMRDALLAEYRRTFELSDQAVRGLTVMYLLRYACDEHADDERVKYAARKISEVIST